MFQEHKVRPVGGHFHDTRNTGVANAWAALEAGATVLDASVGGLGGCPFAPNSTGNVATEDVLYLLEREGVETGVDLDGVIETAHWLEGVLGRSCRAGSRGPAASESRSGHAVAASGCLGLRDSSASRRPSARTRAARSTSTGIGRSGCRT